MLRARLSPLSLLFARTIVFNSSLAILSAVSLGVESRSSIILPEKPVACDVNTQNLPCAANTAQLDAGVDRIRTILESVRATSFSELSNVDIGVRTFRSSSNYFRTRFSVSRYLTFRRMRFFLEVNPRVFALGVPEEGLPAIIAHELEHVLYLSKRSRLGLLSLARLASANSSRRFERGADLRAIARGYGPGLVLYRQWLYKNVDAKTLKEKQRDYFSPDEISAIQSILQIRPQAMSYWLQHVPVKMSEIKTQAPVSEQ